LVPGGGEDEKTDKVLRQFVVALSG
jgi:hypothetical protein